MIKLSSLKVRRLAGVFLVLLSLSIFFISTWLRMIKLSSLKVHRLTGVFLVLLLIDRIVNVDVGSLPLVNTSLCRPRHRFVHLSRLFKRSLSVLAEPTVATRANYIRHDDVLLVDLVVPGELLLGLEGDELVVVADANTRLAALPLFLLSHAGSHSLLVLLAPLLLLLLPLDLNRPGNSAAVRSHLVGHAAVLPPKPEANPGHKGGMGDVDEGKEEGGDGQE